MTTRDTAAGTFFIGGLEPGELEEVLRRIDENLELRPLLRQRVDEDASPTAESIQLPDLADLPQRLRALRQLDAPFFLVRERGLRGFAKRAVNGILKFVAFKQVLFNRQSIEVKEGLLEQVEGIRRLLERRGHEHQLLVSKVDHHEEERLVWEKTLDRLLEQRGHEHQLLASKVERHEEQWLEWEKTFDDVIAAAVRKGLEAPAARLIEQDMAITTLSANIEQLEETLQSALNGVAEQITQNSELRTVLQLETKANQKSAEDIQGHQRWLDALASDLHGHTAWIERLQSELREGGLLLRDVSDRVKTGSDHQVPKARVVNNDDYKALLRTMPDGLRVNLGCGTLVKKGWINVDRRELNGVNVVADLARLPFGPGTLAEIETSHVVEHFREHYLTTQLLPYWHGLLKSGGILRTICPNWEHMLTLLNSGSMSIDDFKLLTFGGQEYEGNDHFTMYTPATLERALYASGFVDCQLIAAARMNGLCPEMEMLATKP